MQSRNPIRPPSAPVQGAPLHLAQFRPAQLPDIPAPIAWAEVIALIGFAALIGYFAGQNRVRAKG